METEADMDMDTDMDPDMDMGMHMGGPRLCETMGEHRCEQRVTNDVNKLCEKTHT